VGFLLNQTVSESLYDFQETRRDQRRFLEQEQTLKEEEGNVKACVDEASTAVRVFNSLHK